MAFIVEQFVGDRAIQLGNEEFVRSMQWGNNWNALRYGIRFVLNGSSNILTARLQLGLCNGNAFPFSSPNCIQYVGAQFGTMDNTWTYTTGSYSNDSSSTGLPTTVTRVGATITNTNSVGALNQYCNASNSSRMGVWAVDIIRVSATQVTIRQTFSNAASVANAVSFYDFMRFMENEGAASATGFSAWGATRTITLTSTVLDTTSIYWNHSTPTIEITDMCVVRFY